MTDQANPAVSQAAARVGHYRWIIVGLLFAATVINYVDRQMIGVLKPTLMTDLGWSELDFANVVFWFQTAYAIGYIGFGRIVDLIGARLGYAIAFVIWTLAHIAHGGVYSVTNGRKKRFGTGRVFDTLLDETSILGIAQGAAHIGLLPIPEIQYLAYLHNALDQLRGEAASLQFFSSVGLVLFLLGLGLGIPVVTEFLHTGLVPRLPTAVLAMGLVGMAMLSLAAGLILDSVARGRKELKRLAYLAIPRTGSEPGMQWHDAPVAESRTSR